MTTTPLDVRVSEAEKPSAIAGARLSDAPIESEADDLLDRSRFAKSVADMLLGMGGAGSIRAGVYGKWGEGKTSVLGMIAREVRRRGGTAVWFSPWPADSAKALRFRLISQIAAALNVRHTTLKSLRGVSSLLSAGRHLASASSSAAERVDAHVGAFAQSFVDEKIYRKADKFLTQIRRDATSQIVVLVDDLDRVQPERLPDLLLLLRDGLDFPAMRFVLALDPGVVHEGLKAIHPAWGEQGSFLEKIVEYPRYLPSLTPDQLDNFIQAEVKRGEYDLFPSAVTAITPLLPRHPRKAKLLLRLLTSFNSFLGRFGEGEFRVAPFYIAQILIAEFPTQVASLLSNKDLRKTLNNASFFQHSASYRDRDPFEPLHVLLIDDADRERFITLAKALADESDYLADHPPSFYLSIADSPPAITLKELDAFLSKVSALDPEPRRAAVAQFISDGDSAPSRIRTTEFWHKLITSIPNGFEAAIDRHLSEQVSESLEGVTFLLSVLEDVVHLGAFEHDMLGPSDWLACFNAFLKYASWHHPDYARFQQRKVEVLDAATRTLTSDQRRSLTEPLWEQLTNGTDRDDRASAVYDLAEALLDTLIEDYANTLIRNFAAVQGVLAPTYTSRLERWMWFDPTSPLYSTASGKRLQGVLRAATPTVAMSVNAYELFGSLVGATTGGGSIRSDTALELLKLDNMAASLWGVSTAQRLNRRMMGSLRQYADTLVNKFAIAASWFPQPSWAEPAVAHSDDADPEIEA